MKKDINFFFTKQGQKFESWYTWISIVPTLISVIVLLVGICLIIYGQDVTFVSDIGIGLLTSSIVTLIFLINNYLKKEIANRNNRAQFFEDFTLFLFDSLMSLPVLSEKNKNYCIKDYIVHQHRRFHDNYKKIIVNSQNCSEIFELKILARKIINTNKTGIDEIFNSKVYRIEAGPFIESELELLSAYYSNFQAMIDTINDDNDVVIYHTAMWLTSNRQLLEIFSELKNMNAIQIVYDEEGKLIADYSEYVHKEPLIKSRLEFQKIRKRNYSKIYSKTKDDNNNNMNNF